MTPEFMMPELLDVVRNLYGAAGGAVPGPAWTATLATLLWIWAYDDAPAAGEDALAERLGWTEAQYEQFYNDPVYDFTPDGARRFDAGYDALEWMTRNRQ